MKINILKLPKTGPKTYTGGGRYPQKIHYDPENAYVVRISAKEKNELFQYLKEKGLNPYDYMIDDTVHGSWKIKQNQASILIKK